MDGCSWWKVVLVTSHLLAAEGARILMLPQNVNSHMIYFGRLAIGLAEEGHVVTTLAASSSKVPEWMSKQTEVILYKVKNENPFATSEEASKILVSGAFVKSSTDRMAVFRGIGKQFASSWSAECEDLMDNKELMQRVENGGYDFAVVDGSALDCLVVLPYKLGIPYATYCVAFSPWLYRVPSLPSAVPSHASQFTDQMSFSQRLHSLMYETFIAATSNTSTRYSKKYAPEKTPLTKVELFQKSSLWLLLRDYTIHYPSPSMPNVIEIGDILGSPAQPLPTELEKTLNASKAAMLFSLGSYIDHMPENVTRIFCEAFGKIPKITILWKSVQRPDCDLPDNVFIYKWLPQNDVLAHPKLKLFMTHAGINSMSESIYQGVPMLAIPLFMDQPFNAAYLQDKGLGRKIDLPSMTTNSLIFSIKEAFQDNTIRDNVLRYSELMRDKPTSPSKRASFWINHVVKYGDEHLRTGAYELNHLQFFMVDVYAFLAVVMAIVLFVVGLVGYLLIKCCIRKCWKVKKD